MAIAKQLTLNLKTRYTPIILQRDYPNGVTPTCFYCEQRFIKNHPLWKKEWDHLDNDTTHNDVSNHVWAHAHCNERKKNDLDWQILASEKKKQNEKWAVESLGEGEKKRVNTAHTQTQPNEQIDANADAARLAEEFLIERLLPRNGRPAIDDQIDFNEAADTIAYRCFKKHGHGSQNTITRILKMLTCDDSSFGREKRDGRTVIFRSEGR